jgi:hypothetical protein
MKIKYPQTLLSNEGFNNDNLHRIAISNLQDHERQVIRWWCKKYRTPQKPFGEHTIEELIVEMLEDYYERNPQEIGKFVTRTLQEPEWDGTMSPEYEAEIQKRLERINRRNGIDISKFQSDENLSDEEAQNIIDNLGRNLPRSTMVTKKDEADTISEDEFEESF